MYNPLTMSTWIRWACRACGIMNHTEVSDGSPPRPLPTVKCEECGRENENVADWQEDPAGATPLYMGRPEGLTLRWFCSRCNHSNEQPLPRDAPGGAISATCECGHRERILALPRLDAPPGKLS